jgi:hypothetical protein
MEELGPLHEAAGMGRMDTCKYLVEELGFDINSEANDDSGMGMLYLSKVNDLGIPLMILITNVTAVPYPDTAAMWFCFPCSSNMHLL